MTTIYPIGDERRFEMGTPAQVQSSLARCWTLEPTSDRICEDVMGFEDVLRKIIAAQGCYVPDIAYRHGRRAYRRDTADGARGAPLKHNARPSQRIETNVARPWHPDCDETRQLFLYVGTERQEEIQRLEDFESDSSSSDSESEE